MSTIEKFKTYSTKKKISYIISIFLLLFLISWDIITSNNDDVEEGIFRLENEFDGVTSATANVAIVPSNYEGLSASVSRDIDPGEEQIELMVRKAIELQGGLWVVEPGDTVMVKVNLVGANEPAGTGENTDYRVVKALMKVLYEHTEGNVVILIAEGTARTNDDPNEEGSVWENSGYTSMLSDEDVMDIDFQFLNLNQTIDDLIEVNLGSHGTSYPQGYKYHIHKKELTADVYIAVPVLKIHDTGITNALKLQIGSAPGCYYGYNKAKGSIYSDGIIHDVGPRRWTTEAIVDLSKIADIDYVLVDAIMCLETYKSDNGSNRVRMNTVIAGNDAVAVDNVCSRLLGLNPDDIAHITLAEKVGLGTNNPEQIEILGTPIDVVKKRFKHNTSANGKFGQSNRTWVLSESFAGTDIENKFIEGEDTLRPVPGENGWSEPTYFFDDRIDLLSYYNGLSNICTYAFTYFTSDSAQTAELWLGSSESMKVYLNGINVYSFKGTNIYSDSDIETDKIDVAIRKGVNSILVKTINTYGEYSFALNICEQENDINYAGNRVEGLKFTTIDTTTGGMEMVTGIKEEIAGINTINEVRLFPSPVEDFAQLQFSSIESGNLEVKIYDIQGKLVSTPYQGNILADKNKIPLDLSSLKSNNFYICSLVSGENITSIKFHKK